MKIKNKTTLLFQEGTSDKIYNAWLSGEEGLWNVNFSYGRRGSQLTDGSKTKEPVSHPEALNILSSLIRSKTTKGYQAAEGGFEKTWEIKTPTDALKLDKEGLHGAYFYQGHPEMRTGEKQDDAHPLLWDLLGEELALGAADDTEGGEFGEYKVLDANGLIEAHYHLHGSIYEKGNPPIDAEFVLKGYIVGKTFVIKELACQHKCHDLAIEPEMENPEIGTIIETSKAIPEDKKTQPDDLAEGWEQKEEGAKKNAEMMEEATTTLAACIGALTNTQEDSNEWASAVAARGAQKSPSSRELETGHAMMIAYRGFRESYQHYRQDRHDPLDPVTVTFVDQEAARAADIMVGLSNGVTNQEIKWEIKKELRNEKDWAESDKERIGKSVRQVLQTAPCVTKGLFLLEAEDRRLLAKPETVDGKGQLRKGLPRGPRGSEDPTMEAPGFEM